MSTNFEVLLKRMQSAGIKPNTAAAREWYRKKVRSLGTTRTQLINDSNRSNNLPTIGMMYCYAYDPKYAEKLPYYDEFPLIFVIDTYANGFMGLNLHYISPKMRIKVMDSLTQITNNKKYDETTKLVMSYNVLQNLARFNIMKPCIKKYLYSHVRSRFVKIESNEWDIGIFLPVQKFKKAAPSTVWSKSALQR